MGSKDTEAGGEIGVAAQRQVSQTEAEMKDVSRSQELVAQYGETHRGLKPRHVHLMAIGGSIGVGLWVSLGHPFHLPAANLHRSASEAS